MRLENRIKNLEHLHEKQVGSHTVILKDGETMEEGARQYCETQGVDISELTAENINVWFITPVRAKHRT